MCHIGCREDEEEREGLDDCFHKVNQDG
jgi:hypothetical protein